jgi:hypothetical protein
MRILRVGLNVKTYLAKTAFPTLSMVELVSGRISMFTAEVVHIRIEDSTLTGYRGYFSLGRSETLIVRLMHSHIGPLSSDHLVSSPALRRPLLSAPTTEYQAGSAIPASTVCRVSTNITLRCG